MKLQPPSLKFQGILLFEQKAIWEGKPLIHHAISVESSADPTIGVDEIQLRARDYRTDPMRNDLISLGTQALAAEITADFEQSIPQDAKSTELNPVPAGFLNRMPALLNVLHQQGQLSDERHAKFQEAAQTATAVRAIPVITIESLETDSVLSTNWNLEPPVRDS